MPDDVTQGLGDFLDYVYGDTVGMAYVATIKEGTYEKGGMFEWPLMRSRMISYLLQQSGAGKDAHICPNLFRKQEDGSTPKFIRENILGSRVLHVDIDKGKAPKDWAARAEELGIPEPTWINQSSVEGNQHVYWGIQEFQEKLGEVEWVEDKSRALTSMLDGDLGKWTVNTLLRPPMTLNYGFDYKGDPKDWYRGQPEVVKVIKSSDKFVSATQFSSVAKAEKALLNTITLGPIPTPLEALALGSTSQRVFDWYSMTKDEAAKATKDGRSGSLQQLAYRCAESGLTNEQMYSLIYEADTRWEKYSGRSPSTRHRILLDTVVKARAKIGNVSDDQLDFAGLLGTGGPQEINQRTSYDWLSFEEADFKVDWIMEGLITRCSQGTITGPPGVGKTQFAINFAISLALGASFLNWNNTAGPVKVALLSLEMSGPELKMFTSKIIQHYDMTTNREIANNFTIIPAGDELPLDRPEGKAYFANLLNEHKPDVLFIDSLQKMTSGALTDEQKIRELMSYLRRIRTEYNVAIYFIHHDRKKQKGTDADQDNMYGSTYIAANSDRILNLSFDPEIKDQLLLSDWKNRFGIRNWHPIEIVRNANLVYSVPSVSMKITEEPGEQKGIYI